MLIDVKAALAEIMNEAAAIPAIPAMSGEKPAGTLKKSPVAEIATPAIPAMPDRRTREKSRRSQASQSQPQEGANPAISPNPLQFLERVHGAGVQVPPESRKTRESQSQPAGDENLTAERAAIAAADGGVPEPYDDAWAALQAGPPAGVSRKRWWQAVEDAGAFLDTWGDVAAALGWPADHLFAAPHQWIGGLVWEICGGAVVALTDRQAVIDLPDGRRAWFGIPRSDLDAAGAEPRSETPSGGDAA